MFAVRPHLFSILTICRRDIYIIYTSTQCTVWRNHPRDLLPTRHQLQSNVYYNKHFFLKLGCVYELDKSNAHSAW